jgi:hypothetical protein
VAEEVEGVDALYGLDPSEFTAARNALAKRLRSEGRREDAAAVAALRKPNVVAAALNRAARRSPELVDDALAAGDRLRAATEAAVGGDASGLREANAEDRKATDALVDEAAGDLANGGASLREKAAATIRAAVLDEDLADELRRGVLETDHSTSDLGIGFGFGLAATADGGDATVIDLPAARRARAAKRRPNADDREAERVRAEAAEAERARRRHVAALEEAASKAEAHASRLVARAERLEAEAAEARREADEASAAAEEARRAVDDA